MSAIRSRDTKPEMIVRRLLHSEGYRYFVSKRLEGFRPDLVFVGRRKAIFVHGCFWHGHPTCGRDRVPKTRTDYWRKKIEGNRLRDERAQNALERSGWCVMVLWECEISRAAGFLPHVMEFLGPPRLAQENLELGKNLLDRVKVKAVRRQEEYPCSRCANGGAHSVALMASQIVQDDDVAGLSVGIRNCST
jgi:DNA mismatch endonuclease, patch repair protein